MQHPAGQCPTTALAALIALAVPAAAAADAGVYRCVGADGGIEFRQFACDANAAGEQIDIEDTRTGWTPPSGEAIDKAPERKPKKAPKRPAANAEAKAKAQADQCWKKRRQVEDVNWRLRAGYTAAEGVRLYHRRDEYEAYLRRFCVE